jgi:hypothetical protein
MTWVVPMGFEPCLHLERLPRPILRPAAMAQYLADLQIQFRSILVVTPSIFDVMRDIHGITGRAGTTTTLLRSLCHASARDPLSVEPPRDHPVEPDRAAAGLQLLTALRELHMEARRPHEALIRLGREAGEEHGDAQPIGLDGRRVESSRSQVLPVTMVMHEDRFTDVQEPSARQRAARSTPYPNGGNTRQSSLGPITVPNRATPTATSGTSSVSSRCASRTAAS